MKNEEQQQQYPDIPDAPLTLRDKLAISRTTLANERTMLAYFRTALAILITGISLIKFFDSLVLETLGWSLLPLGILTIFIGTRRFRQMSIGIHRSACPDEESKKIE